MNSPGYEFNKTFNLHELILKFELKYNSTLLNCYLKDIKNHNVLVLESFFNSNKIKNWDYNFLIKWLENYNIKSNLVNNSANTILELFNLALGDGYFADEDSTLWSDLQNLYFFNTD